MCFKNNFFSDWGNDLPKQCKFVHYRFAFIIKIVRWTRRAYRPSVCSNPSWRKANEGSAAYILVSRLRGTSEVRWEWSWLHRSFDNERMVKPDWDQADAMPHTYLTLYHLRVMCLEPKSLDGRNPLRFNSATLFQRKYINGELVFKPSTDTH